MPTSKNEPRPNSQEILFLNHAYNFFLDIYNEMGTPSFWEKDAYYRFNKIKDAFLVYSEVLEYEPIGTFIEVIRKFRPPMEAELSSDFLLFIRNLLIHFPFFNSWDEVKFSKALVNWSKPGRSIDKFVTTFGGRKEVKYRAFSHKTETFTYITINFPAGYEENKEVALKDFMPEKDGALFTMSLMHRVLMSQVEEMIEKPDILE